jgi:signal peptidase II
VLWERISDPLSFITGGAIGNLIDRIAYGKVVDFLDFDFFDISLFGYRLERWWTFNIADMAISLSILYLFVRILFTKQTANVEEKNISSKF